MPFKQCRMRAGLSQGQVAKYLGISRTTVSKWDVMFAKPRAELLPKIASLYACTIDDLLSPADDFDDEILPENGGEQND